MFLCLNLLALLLLLQTVLPSPLTTASRGGRSKTSPGRTTANSSNARGLSAGASCGVYTQGCGHGLRCAPPEDGPRPLRALLEGRGVCREVSGAGPSTDVILAEPATTVDPEQAPCRRLLTTLVQGFDAHLFTSHHDIYMPNCDKRGFFRKKQCWSSRGQRRGKCWCVDENGLSLPANTKHKNSC